MNCIICNNLLKRKQIKYCSIKCHNQDTNNRYNNYKCQQQRGRQRKLNLIKLRQNKCEICGYNKNYASLDFHHINPSEKEFGLDLRKLSNSTWQWCLREAQKCRLLCSNCHREIHNPDCLIN